jgi:sulfatase maturation enzyme AslB (radical SAM superfamily)
MRKWAFNILATASKKNARRRERLFKYFNAETKSKSFQLIEIDIEKGFRPNIIDIESQIIIYDPPRDDEEDEYEPIDWHT